MPDQFVEQREMAGLHVDSRNLRDRFEKGQDRTQPHSIINIQGSMKLLAKRRHVTLDTITHQTSALSSMLPTNV